MIVLMDPGRVWAIISSHWKHVILDQIQYHIRQLSCSQLIPYIYSVHNQAIYPSKVSASFPS